MYANMGYDMAEKQQLKARTRDKKAKIACIIDATLHLIEVKGYASVTSRDIAKEAGVSNGLVFKYFPEGKPSIIKELGLMISRDTFKFHMPDTVDFNDFPGFLRTALAGYITYERKYFHLHKALTIALESDKKLYSCVEELYNTDQADMLAFFVQFKDININRSENPGEFIAKWLFIINAVIDHHLLYPLAFSSDDKLIDMLVEISLKLWDYNETIEK